MKRTMVMTTSIVLAFAFAGMMAPGTAAMQATPLAAGGSGADVQAATEWLISQQDESGGFPGFNGEPEVGITVDAVIALVSAQLNGIDVGASIDDAVAFLDSGDGALVYAQTGAGQAAKLVMGVVAVGGDPHSIAGVDPLVLVENDPSEDTALYGAGVYDHALALLALGATGSEVPERALAALNETQAPEGGWAFDGTTIEGAADSNTTALVIMSLVATGNGDSPLISEGLGYLQTTLVGASGATFQATSGAMADANSTALALQAALAVGDDPADEGWGDLPAALATFQNESGAFYYNEADTADNLFATVQAIPAAAGYALPVVPAAESEATPAATPVALVGDRELLLVA